MQHARFHDKLCLLSRLEQKLPENLILHKIFFFSSVVLVFLESASRSPENCLTDPKRTADPSLRTTAQDGYAPKFVQDLGENTCSFEAALKSTAPGL